MIRYLMRFFVFMSPAFSRQATYGWFVVAFVGLVLRYDTFGVSSIVRALYLTPESYNALLHFFHSTAWDVETFMALWQTWLIERNLPFRVGDRPVFIGDHTKSPKDGRKIPAVVTLHQNSETASKPSFFRGHHWGCIATLVQACEKWFATPLQACIQEGVEGLADPHNASLPKTTWIVEMARRVCARLGCTAYLVLDAYFAVGPVFLAAAAALNGVANPVHILTRAKKNVVAYLPARPRKKGGPGRQKKYGEKLKLIKLFDLWAGQFETGEALVYGRREQIRYLALNLLWKPTKGMLRFILAETSRGPIILITSDLDLDPLVALELYCHRATIETLFDTLKNKQGGMGYHFWSRYLKPASRRPVKNKRQDQRSSKPDRTRNTLAAIEKFLNLQLVVIGTLQLLAATFPKSIKAEARCWLRTDTSHTPSEFVTRTALANTIRYNLCGFANDWITQLIRRKQQIPSNHTDLRDAA